MKQPKFKKAFKRVFKKGAMREDATVEDIFMMLYHTKYMIIDSWADMEDVVEDVFGERPDWQECKKRMREEY